MSEPEAKIRIDVGVTRRNLLKTAAACTAGALLPQSSPLHAAAIAYDFQPVKERINAAIAAGKANGIAVAITRHGRIVWEEGFGWADRQAGIKVTHRTPFCLASISKPFTTTTIMTLVAAGALSLEDAANRHLGANGLRGSPADLSEATIRRLGAHAAGLPTMFNMIPRDSRTPPPPNEPVLREYGRLAFPPGQIYEYSNIGYSTLGAIAAQLTKKEFGVVMTQRVLRPLGLSDSYFDSGGTPPRRPAKHYDELGKEIPSYWTVTPPSGEVYASAHDVARFAMFNMKDHLSDQAAILSDSLIDELHRPSLVGPNGAAATFGWFTGHTKTGLFVITKDGGQPGVSTKLAMIPSERLSCVVLTNRTASGKFAQELLDLMVSTILPDWSYPDSSMTLPSTPFNGVDDFTGEWSGELVGGGIIRPLTIVIAANGSATLALGGQSVEQIADLRLQGNALIGKSAGIIGSADTMRTDARSLSLKLIQQNGKLSGRILAARESPGWLTTLPNVVDAQRK